MTLKSLPGYSNLKVPSGETNSSAAQPVVTRKVPMTLEMNATGSRRRENQHGLRRYMGV